MLEKIKKTFLGSHSKRKLREYQLVLKKVNQLQEKFSHFDQAACEQMTANFKQQLQQGKSINDLLPEAFALVRHAATVVLQQTHYDVQIIGGVALHQGNIAEMKTGEGKTLTSTLPVYLNALTGKGVHVVTVNDYLAKRDSEWMGGIFNYLGLSVGLLQNGIKDDERRLAYQADVTYGTNNEFGFDYLRDNMKFQLQHCVQRGHHYAIIDEVDSVLIDEARTPLIISGVADESTDKYYVINNNIIGLKRASRKIENPDKKQIAAFFSIQEADVDRHIYDLKDDSVVTKGDYTLDEKSRNILLTEQGVELLEKRLENLLNPGGIYDLSNIDYLHHIQQALKAHYIFKRDVDYLLENSKVKIVDEFTGRVMEGRRFSDGLHQALEAKEGVPIQRENQTLATITYQNYFRKYEKLAGMTGTAETEEEEFIKIYKLGVVVIPTHRPMIRIDQPDLIYKNKSAKYHAIVEQIKQLHAKQQPVLVGTDSIENSETLSKHLQRTNIPHVVLNAKYHAQEADIVANAGSLGKVTIATNMAGRGTDIKLAQGVKERGGLFILGTVRHESRRVDNQLRGRSGRQGDPGESRFFLSLEDDLLRVFGGDRIASLMTRLKMDEGEAIENALISRAIENAQKKVEAQNFSIRKHLLEYDDVLNRQREVIYNYRQDILGDNVHDFYDHICAEFVTQFVQSFATSRHSDEWQLDSLVTHFKEVFRAPLEKSDLTQATDIEALETIIRQKVVEQLALKRQSLAPLAKEIERHVALNMIDSAWKEHLKTNDQVKESVGLRGYAQKSPLDEYKKEAFIAFQHLILSIQQSCVETYFRTVLRQESAPVLQKEEPEQNYQMIHEKRPGLPQTTEANQRQVAKKQPIVNTHTKVGRNEPCPCDSGKKFKHCNCEFAQRYRQLGKQN